MNYVARPPRRGLLPDLPPDLIAEIARVEHVVFTRARPALAWRIFSNVELWPKFCSLYKNIRWQGAPWTTGSRLHIELGEPIHAIVDRALTVCTPPYHIAWISHVRGYTMEQWISLDPVPGGSKVSTWIDVTGAGISRNREFDLEQLKRVVTTWFNNFGRECDHVADAAEGGDIRSATD